MGIPKRLGYIGLARQTVKGTGVAPTKFVKWDGGTQMTPALGFTKYREGGDGFNPGLTLKENHKPDGSFSLLARPDIIAFLLAMWAGQDTVTGAAAPYTHTIVPKADGARPWVTIERSIAGQIIERVIDARIKTITLEGEPGKPVKATVEYVAINSAPQGAAATETYETNMPFIHFNGTYTKDGAASTDIGAWKITLTNNFDEDDFTNAITRRDIPLLSWDAEVEFTVKFETGNVAIYKDTYYGGGTAPTTTMDGGSFKAVLSYGAAAALNELSIDIPQLWYTEAPLELDTGDESQAYEIKATAGKGGSDMVTIVAKNGTTPAYV